MTAVTTSRVPVSDRAVVVLLVAVAAGLVLTRRLYQAVQTDLAGLVTDAPTVHSGSECTSAFLLVPLLLLVSILVALRPRFVRRALAALGFTALELVAVDQLRVLAAAGSLGWLSWLLGVLGGLAAPMLFVWLTVRREKP